MVVINPCCFWLQKHPSGLAFQLEMLSSDRTTAPSRSKPSSTDRLRLVLHHHHHHYPTYLRVVCMCCGRPMPAGGPQPSLGPPRVHGPGCPLDRRANRSSRLAPLTQDRQTHDHDDNVIWTRYREACILVAEAMVVKGIISFEGCRFLGKSQTREEAPA